MNLPRCVPHRDPYLWYRAGSGRPFEAHEVGDGMLACVASIFALMDDSWGVKTSGNGFECSFVTKQFDICALKVLA